MAFLVTKYAGCGRDLQIQVIICAKDVCAMNVNIEQTATDVTRATAETSN